MIELSGKKSTQSASPHGLALSPTRIAKNQLWPSNDLEMHDDYRESDDSLRPYRNGFRCYVSDGTLYSGIGEGKRYASLSTWRSGIVGPACMRGEHMHMLVQRLIIEMFQVV